MKKWLSLALCLLAFGCGKKDNLTTVRVGASPVPQSIILEFVKYRMKQEGYKLEIIEIVDYNIPNRALAENEIDVNFFQHIPFMDEQIKDLGYKIECLARIHLEPMAIYSKKVDSLEDLKTGSTIAIPNDVTNEYRALALLEEYGLIQLKQGGSKLQATTADITSNPKQLKFKEIDSATLTRTLKDVDAAAIPTNFALQAGLTPKQNALAIESADSPYANILAIRIGDKNKPKLQALKNAMLTDEMRAYILKTFKGAIIPVLDECPQQ